MTACKEVFAVLFSALCFIIKRVVFWWATLNTVFFANLAWENNRFFREGRKLADWILAVVWRFVFAYIARLRLYVCDAADFIRAIDIVVW